MRTTGSTKKILSMLLALAMILGAVPFGLTVYAATQLPAPANVRWVDNNGTAGWDSVPNSGDPDPADGSYDIALYRDGKRVTGNNTSTVSNTGRQEFRFADDINESGTYYFEVAAQGNGTDYTQSAFARSDDFVYVKPNAQLGTATNLHWETRPSYDYVPCWDEPANAETNDYYRVTLFKNGAYCSGSNFTRTTAGEEHWFDGQIKASYGGDGVYTFRVQAISSRISEIITGEQSDISLPLLVGVSDSVTVTLVTNGGKLSSSFPSVQHIPQGGYAAEARISKAGSTFEGWYSDSALKNKWDFTTPVSSNMTLYAKWSGDDAPDVRDLGDGQVVIGADDGDVIITGTYSDPDLGYTLYGHAAVEIAQGYTGTITLRDTDITLTKGLASDYQGARSAIRNCLTERKPETGDVTINLEGTNTITVGDAIGLESGARMYNTLITGDGSWNVSFPTGSAISLYNCTIDADVTGTGLYNGIYMQGDSAITGGTVYAYGGDSSNSHGLTIREAEYYDGNGGTGKTIREPSHLEITGGTIRAESDGGTGLLVYAASINIGAPLTAISRSSSPGIWGRFGSEFTVSSTVTAEGANGIQTEPYSTRSLTGDLTITPTGNLTVIGNGYSYLHSSGDMLYYDGHGAKIVGDLTVNGTINATGTTQDQGGYGIFLTRIRTSTYPDEPVMKVGPTGKVIAQGGATQDNAAPGIVGCKFPAENSESGYSTTTQFIKEAGGSVKAYAGEGSNPAYGAAWMSNYAATGWEEVPNFLDGNSEPETPVISITTQPEAELTVTAGAITETLSVEATVSDGSAPSYQWFSTEDGSTADGTLLDGATSAEFALPADLASGVYLYYCQVSATDAVAVHSTVAKVIVNPEEPTVVPSEDPTVVSDDPINLDLTGVKTAYISVSLGFSATGATVSVDGSSVTATPETLDADGNIRVDAVREGTSTISIAFDGVDPQYNTTVTARVTRGNTVPTYTIAADAGTGGRITPSGNASVAEFGTLTFAITPYNNYIINQVLVDDVSVGAVSGYTF
ncbi:InlB B-repeat-containing protein, partial [Ruminococcaceae bacterium OttesenSCG-928-L11]|nr:InlB B-repeat-containing protein [Ruminococcaceae bacterium OttesenSCG-928-L11]